MCHAARRGGSSIAVLGESSALFRHWTIELLRAMIDLHKMSAYESVTSASLLSLDNVFISSEGTVVKLGELACSRE